jgi:protoporphyrinogen/coproporphyrinogen III oxidase
VADNFRSVIIGGGISGLAAAWRLVQHGEQDICVLEASSRLGGKLQTTSFDGQMVDTGADAFLTRVPEALQLCRELGLEDELVAPTKSSALVWSRGALRQFPKTTVLGIPSNIDDVASTGIISPAGIERARNEVNLPVEPVAADMSVGELVSTRFGNEIKERLVDPLVGGINAGSVDRLDLASATPQIFAMAQRNLPLTVAAHDQLQHRPTGPATSPFLCPRSGMQRIVDRLVELLRKRGVTIALDAPVHLIVRNNQRWQVDIGDNSIDAGTVIVATPSQHAASLLQTSFPGIATQLGNIRYASVTIVRMAYRPESIGVNLDYSGFVIPAVENTLLTACSWTSSKWSSVISGKHVIVRASAGRIDDLRHVDLDNEQLINVAHGELRDMMQIDGEPQAADVTTWPEAFPQYEPGHAMRVTNLFEELRELEGLFLAGAAYQGLGVPACVRSGFTAADQAVSSR